MLTEKTYPYKHWLSYIILGALLVTAYSYFNDPFAKLSASIDSVILYAVFGLVLSLPAFILYLILFKALYKTAGSSFILKIILNLVAITSVMITLKIVFNNHGTLIMLLYTIAVVLSSLFYPIKQKEEPIE